MPVLRDSAAARAGTVPAHGAAGRRGRNLRRRWPSCRRGTHDRCGNLALRQEIGRHYRLPTDADYTAVHRAQERVAGILDEWEQAGSKGRCPVPDEPTPAGGGSGAGRAFSVQRYGMLQWGDVFTARQKAALITVAHAIKHSSRETGHAMREVLSAGDEPCRG